MKTKLTLSAAFIFALLTHAFAITRTVSNNNGSPGQYTTFAAAHTAAVNGDTILVHGSATNYGTFTVQKRLTIIGTGHNPQKQAPLVSTVDYINISSTAKGTKVIGFNVYEVNTQNQEVDSIEIRLCYFQYRINMDDYYANDWIIDGNVFVSSGININGGCFHYGHRIRNNFFNGYIQSFGNCQSSYSYLENNIFVRNNDVPLYDVYSFYVNNNIFYRVSYPGGSFTSNTFSNNISYMCGNNNFPNGVNQVNVNPLFVNFPNAGAYFSYAYDFHLQPGSPAIAAGNDGTDLGVYGGVGDYNQYGIPRNPQIKEFNIANPTISSGGTLNINFKSTIR
jgi:hypothetical protein